MIEPNLEKRGRPYNPNPLLRALCGALLKMVGWKAVGTPPPYPKYVLVAAPHTSNWDFALFILVAGYFGIRPSFMAKDSLFRPAPMGMLMRALGGVAIDRSQPNQLVPQAIAAFESHNEFILMITPEGTRKWVPRWKRGFYHIARGAGVPVALAYVDYVDRVCGFAGTFFPSEDIESNLRTIQEFYADKRGKFPAQAGPVLQVGAEADPASGGT